MPLRQILESRGNGRSVRLPSILQVLESLLPKLLDIRQMADVLSNRPLPLELKSCAGVVYTDKQCVNSRQQAAKAFEEVRQHPRRMNEGKRPLRPWRTIELRRSLNSVHAA